MRVDPGREIDPRAGRVGMEPAGDVERAAVVGKRGKALPPGCVPTSRGPPRHQEVAPDIAMSLSLSPALALLALLIEALVGYPAPLYRAIGHPVTWIGGGLGWLEARLNRANLGFAARRGLGGLALALTLAPVALVCRGGDAVARARGRARLRRAGASRREPAGAEEPGQACRRRRRRAGPRPRRRTARGRDDRRPQSGRARRSGRGARRDREPRGELLRRRRRADPLDRARRPDRRRALTRRSTPPTA